uniref:Peptidase A1 domain-containing protein n=1 Tax=Ditylenchus dipsaci TaxID=166011 RepID=A0A915D065_9BILA
MNQAKSPVLKLIRKSNFFARPSKDTFRFIGTPPQTQFLLRVELFGMSELILMDNTADFSSSVVDRPFKRKFDSHGSSTFLNKESNVSIDWSDYKGYLGSDIVHLSHYPFNATVGLLQTIPYYLAQESYSGFLGLSWNAKNNSKNIADAMTDKLDYPVISVWTNRYDKL